MSFGVRADEDVLAVEPDPDDPVAGRAVCAQRGNVDVVRSLERLADIGWDRDEHAGLLGSIQEAP